MKKILLLLMLLCTTFFFAQTNFFSVAKGDALSNPREVLRNIKSKGIFTLNEQAMREYLLPAPIEFKNNGVTIPLEIPLPDGRTQVFNMVESPILSAEVASRHPEIKTYSGKAKKGEKGTIRISFTSEGFNAIILYNDGSAVYFEKYSTTQKNTYFNYYTKDVIVPNGPKTALCKVIDDHLQETVPNPMHRTSVGSDLTTFRLAMAANAEFTAEHGGTTASAFAAIVTYVNRIDAFYRKEMAISFVLVSDENLVYTNSLTDPYDNEDQIAMLDQNQQNCDDVIGNSNYDIGHVWGYVGSSGGGIASLESVCDEFSKGSGVSGEGDLTSYTQVFMDQLVFHEMGHQLGMTHSYNSSIPVCTTRAAATSVEPGSGATIMSYGFTCSDENNSDDYFSPEENGLITGPILQFHTASYEQSLAFLATTSCGVLSDNANTPPVVVVPSSYTIPISTPFSLTGTASDSDGDTLSYCWEGTDIGTMTPTPTTLADTSQPPFFRSYVPTVSGTRTYPLLEKILTGDNYDIGDKLPSIGITTNHRLTVRDDYGGVSNESVEVIVNGSIGPFLETTNLSGDYAALTQQEITWSVNDTDIDTPTINILLSADGGLTFPTTLVVDTDNDGSEMVTFPNVVTTTARIKVEAVDNIFFDISNSDFSINDGSCATVKTWDGFAWMPDEPTSNDKAVIEGDFTATSDLEACSLDVTGTAEVIVPAGFTFFISGAVTVEPTATLTFENDANLLQEGTDNLNAGDIVYTRTANMRRLDYVYWSSPVENQNLQAFSDETLADRFYTINEADNNFVWADPENNSFAAAKGYVIRAPNTFTTTPSDYNGIFTGKPNNGDVQIAVTNNGQGYNLIGNPYPSPISASLFFDENPDVTTLYFWTHTTQGSAPGANYATYNFTGATAASATTPQSATPNGTIMSGQGFIAKTTASGTILFNNSIRTGNNGGIFFRTASSEQSRIWINLNSANEGINQMLVGYIDGATNGLDARYDGKLIEVGGSRIYSLINDNEYIIQGKGLPFVDTDVVPLGFKAAVAGTYTLSIDYVDGLFSEDQSIYLEDLLLGLTHNIKTSAYTFVSEQGTFNNRFRLVYQNTMLNVEEPTLNPNAIVVFNQDNVLHVNSGKEIMQSIRIFDMLGRLVYEKNNVNAMATPLYDFRVTHDIVLVQVVTAEGGTVTKKFVY